MASRFFCSIPLPATFRTDDMLAFHRRDPQEISERVTERSLQKGLLWMATPACLTVRFAAGSANAELAVDGQVAPASEPAFQAMVHRMLGLAQDIEAFEKRYREHPQIGSLIARHAGLRVPVTSTPFEALSWAVTGQQISVGAAVAIRRKLIITVGLRHSSGLFCYPEAPQLAALTEDDLRRAGFSLTKARTLLALGQQVIEGTLPLAEWLITMPIEEIRESLLAVRGVGPWTINYTLLRGLGWLDGSLHGDVAVRRNLQTVIGSADKVSQTQAQQWLAQFSPWRALLAAHLWAATKPGGG